MQCTTAAKTVSINLSSRTSANRGDIAIRGNTTRWQQRTQFGGRGHIVPEAVGSRHPAVGSQPPQLE
jgi:hypothetical protein